MKKIRVIIVMALVALMVFSMTGCGAKPPFIRSGECMNSSVEITIYDEEMKADTAEKILDAAFAEIARLDGILNHKAEGSDVYKLNHAGGEKIEVAQEVRDLMSIYIFLGNESDGAYDIMMGPVNALWGFGTDEAAVPADADIKAALEHVNYGQMATQGSKMWLADPEAQLDFTGLAEGYIAGKVADIIEAEGVLSAKIDINGNVVMIGEAQEEIPAIGNIDLTDKFITKVELSQNAFEQDGVTYHHILDPATGYPAETDLETVTIIANRGYVKYGGILANTAIVMGNIEGQKFVNGLSDLNPDMGLEAVFVADDGTVYKTDGVVPVEEGE